MSQSVPTDRGEAGDDTNLSSREVGMSEEDMGGKTERVCRPRMGEKEAQTRVRETTSIMAHQVSEHEIKTLR